MGMTSKETENTNLLSLFVAYAQGIYQSMTFRN